MAIKKLLRPPSFHPMHCPTGYQRQHYRQRGFTLPLVLGVGLIMMVVALTLISRSQVDVSTASLQKQTQQAFAVAEGGMARTLSLLNGSYHMLLRRTYNPINPNTNQPYLIDRAADATKVGQPNTAGIPVTATNEWTAASLGDAAPPCFNLNALLNGTIGTPPQGSYRLLAYLYDPPTETGHLLIEGRLANNSPANAYILQKMKITDLKVPANFPGLLAERFGLFESHVLGTVNGNVVCTNPNNCRVPANQCVNGQPTNAALRQAVGASKAMVEGTIAINKVELPPFPTPPPTVNASASPPVNGDVQAPNPSALRDLLTSRTQNDGTNSNDRYSEGAYDLGNIHINLGNLNLPRPGDRPYVDTSLPVGHPDRIYYAYKVGNIILNGTKITINTSRWPVRLFVSGNIFLNSLGSERSGIQNICSPNSSTCGTGANMGLPSGVGTPDRLRIYGNPPDPNNAVPDQTFNFNGTSFGVDSAFIYAPDAQVGITGFSDNPHIYGALWVKYFGTSRSAKITVPDALPKALGTAYQNVSIVVARTKEASNWSRLAQY